MTKPSKPVPRFGEMDPRLTTERMLKNLFDPDEIAKREQAKREKKRVAAVRARMVL